MSLSLFNNTFKLIANGFDFAVNVYKATNNIIATVFLLVTNSRRPYTSGSFLSL